VTWPDRRQISPRRDDNRGPPAILLERVRFKPIGDKPAVGELADAAGRIAAYPAAQATIVHIAAVGVGGQPFADRKRMPPL